MHTPKFSFFFVFLCNEFSPLYCDKLVTLCTLCALVTSITGSVACDHFLPRDC